MEVTLLEENQIFRENTLEIFKKYGRKAAITDFSILLGGYVSNRYHVHGKNSLEDRTGYYWTKTDDGDNDARVVNDSGYSYYNDVQDRDVGVRPALPHSSISSLSTNGVSRRTKNDILEIEYGYYPQMVVSKDMQEELENNFQNQNIIETGNIYTTDSKKVDNYDEYFEPQNHIEYEYNGKKYVRLIVNLGFDGNESTLSNGEKYKDGDIVWVEVEPIKWLVDEKTDLMITEKIICSGIQFNRERNYKGDFISTDMYKFLNTYFIKDIQQNIQKELKIKVEYEKSKQEIELENIQKTKQKILSLRKKLI